MERIGTTLGGRYRLGAKIGKGGMSDVYAATDELLGRDVAVKMMRPDLARDENFLERFRREAQNAAKLNHPTIVAIYDTGQTSEEDGAVPYIVMERVHGDTLREILRDTTKLSLTEAARVMSQVCEALRFSHEAGIIHRDIKPANVMITNTGAVKVMDFGIARALSDSSAMTQTSSVIGTAQYLSPEQARGNQATVQSDIYAAGCVFYELATGHPPFTGDSPFAVAFQHVQEDPQPPSRVEGMHLSKREALSLDAITLTAMAKNPDDRYDYAEQMANDLRLLSEDRLPLVAQDYAEEHDLAAQTGLSRNDTPARDAATTTVMPAAGRRRADERNVGQAANGTVVAGSAGTAGTAGSAQAADMTGSLSPVDSEPQKPRRRGKVVVWSLLAVIAVAGGVAAAAYISDDEPSAPTEKVVEQISIPDVAGQPRDQAEDRLRKAGVSFNVAEQSHDKILRGDVITTDPGAGQRISPDQEITLLVSSGKEVTEVPDVTHMKVKEATAALEKANLTLDNNPTTQPSDSVPAGQVISQSPAQGTQVSVGTRVTLTVSSGEEKVRVPIVTGQSLQNARSNLESAGFEVEVKRVDSEKPEDEVLSATDEGSELSRGSTITLEVSNYNLFEMPNLQGEDYDDALSLLQQAGWRGSPSQVSKRGIGTTDITRSGTIQRQSHSAGEVIRRDSSIAFDVYEFDLFGGVRN